MGYEIIRNTEGSPFAGCDFVVRLSDDRKNTKVKILQLTGDIVYGSFDDAGTTLLWF